MTQQQLWAIEAADDLFGTVDWINTVVRRRDYKSSVIADAIGGSIHALRTLMEVLGITEAEALAARQHSANRIMKAIKPTGEAK